MAINYSKPTEIRDFRNGSWFWIQTHVWRDKRLTKSDKIVYATLASYANGNQTMFPSIVSIAEDADLSERQTYSSIKNLEKNKYIDIERRGGKVNVYTLLKTYPAPANKRREHPTPEMVAPLQSNHVTPAKNGVGTPAKNGVLTISNITISNNNRERTLSSRRFSKIHSLKEEDFKDISTKYNVPLAFVKSKYDDMINWHESTGKTKKNWLATLRNWVKSDALKLRKEQGGQSKITVITPDPNWNT